MKKRICFLVDSIFSIGGVQRVTAVVARALAEECDVTIVTLDPPSAQDTSLYGLDQSPIHYRFFGYPSVGRLKNLLCKAYSAFYRRLSPLTSQRSALTAFLSDLYAHSSFPSELCKALADELRQGHYDTIVGVHAPLAVRLASTRPRLGDVRCVGWLHNSFEALFGPTSLYIGPDRQRHYVYQLRKLDATVVLCRHDAALYRAYDPKLLPTVIYNPLTLQPATASKGNSRRFLAVGRFTPRHKGFDLLIEAFHLFAQTDNDWVIDIVGEGPEEPLYRERIAAYGLEQRVLLHPFTRHVQDYYSQAQVFVLSSRWEGFGLVLVEAMAHGLPVVSSDLPTSLEIMGSFGLYFRNGDIAGLASQLGEATRIDWQEKSREAQAIARSFALTTIMPQWRKCLSV